jgi:hypothetical protein
MRESQRLAYLQAIGVTGWMPRSPLVHAASRLMPEAEVVAPFKDRLAASRDRPPVVAPDEVRTSANESLPVASNPAQTISPSAILVEHRRAQLAAVPVKMTDSVGIPDVQMDRSIINPLTSDGHESQSVAPFYLQLWMAGPCALLVEITDPGLEKGTSEHNLLCDILRAAGLPPNPRLLADFRWPLSRNPQVARSAEAASEAMQAFMQARLEQQSINSIACFGPMAGLLAASDPESAAALVGSEQAIEQLGVGWFAPGIEVLLREPELKASLWRLLKRVMPRWTDVK